MPGLAWTPGSPQAVPPALLRLHRRGQVQHRRRDLTDKPFRARPPLTDNLFGRRKQHLAVLSSASSQARLNNRCRASIPAAGGRGPRRPRPTAGPVPHRLPPSSVQTSTAAASPQAGQPLAGLNVARVASSVALTLAFALIAQFPFIRNTICRTHHAPVRSSSSVGGRVRQLGGARALPIGQPPSHQVVVFVVRRPNPGRARQQLAVHEDALLSSPPSTSLPGSPAAGTAVWQAHTPNSVAHPRRPTMRESRRRSGRARGSAVRPTRRPPAAGRRRSSIAPPPRSARCRNLSGQLTGRSFSSGRPSPLVVVRVRGRCRRPPGPDGGGIHRGPGPAWVPSGQPAGPACSAAGHPPDRASTSCPVHRLPAGRCRQTTGFRGPRIALIVASHITIRSRF